MPSLAQLQVKYPHFKTVIHRKLSLTETQHFCNIITKRKTSIWIAFHADLHGKENSHGSYIIHEIADSFDFIVMEVLRCPLIAQLQRNMYVNKQKQELIEQNGLLFEAEFNNEVGVIRNKAVLKLFRYVT